METVFLIVLLTNKILETNCIDIRVLSDEDVLMTNYSTTRNNIPDECYLFGSELLSSDSLDNIYINASQTGSFWVNANIRFKRNINPIGVLFDCKENRPSNFTLDECVLECRSYGYFSHGTKSCQCTNNHQISENLAKVDACDNDAMGLCSSGKCVLYQQITQRQDYHCGTYTYHLGIGIWTFKTENCGNKQNGFICNGGNVLRHVTNESFTWYGAYQKCKENGNDLVHTGNVDIDNQFKDGKTYYWVSFLRRLEITWGKDYNGELCVAASIEENGTLTLTSKLCNEKLPSLCYRNISANGSQSGLHSKEGPMKDMTGITIGIVFGAVMFYAIILAIVVNQIYKL